VEHLPKNTVNGYAELDLKFQKAGTGTGSGFQSSGAFSVELEAGKTYAIGVGFTDASGVAYYDSEVTPVSLSFAHALGGLSTYSSTSMYYYSPSPSAIYYERLTTTPP
jgi:hypothetical protein